MFVRPHFGPALGPILLLGLSLLVLAHAKPLEPTRPLDNDPMLALPSDHHAPQEVQYITTYQQVAPNPRPVQETALEYRPAQEQQQQPGQLVYTQEQPVAPYQLITPQQQAQQQAQSSVHVHGPDCNQRHEYGSVFSLESGQANQQQYSTEARAPQGEYPGEIVYVNQNGNPELTNMRSVAASLGQNSDLSATILTEVPVKDMPYEVLNKLKREYGVKVVATRDRPGANLVINCDDYPNPDSSVCGRQAQQQQQGPQQIGYHFLQHQQQQAQPPQLQQAPQAQHQAQVLQQQQPSFLYSPALEPQSHSTVEGPAEHQTHRQSFTINHEVQPTGEPASVYVAQDPNQLAGVHSNGHAGLVGLTHHQEPTSEGQHEASYQAAPAGGEQTNNENVNYGTRTSATANEQQTGGVEAHEGNQPASVEHNIQEGSTAQLGAEQSQPSAGHENLDQNAGFDEQPKSGEPEQVQSERPNEGAYYQRQK